MFQSPIGWGLSCEINLFKQKTGIPRPQVSIPYWLGSKLRGRQQFVMKVVKFWFQSPIGWGLSCEVQWWLSDELGIKVSIPYWLGSKLRGFQRSEIATVQAVSIPYWLGSKLRGLDNVPGAPSVVSIPYWLGSKLRGGVLSFSELMRVFQSPIGWGLSCECRAGWSRHGITVSIPYWLGSKLRGSGSGRQSQGWVSIPYWLGSKLRGQAWQIVHEYVRFNPLLVGV
jgi:hypothetical protein